MPAHQSLPRWPLLLLPGAALLRPAVTLLHEGAHALMVLLTGGQIEGLDWAAVAFSGGWAPGVLVVGYLAPALVGLLLARQRPVWLRGAGGLLLLGALLDVLEDRGRGDALLLAALSGTSPLLWSVLWGSGVMVLCVWASAGILKVDPSDP